MSNLRVFGCVAFSHIPEKQRKKFDEKSRKVVFVGYPEGTKGYKLYDPSTRKFIRSRDVVFVERKFHNVDTSSTEFYVPVDDTPQVVAVGDHDESDEEENEPEIVHNQPVGATYEENFMRETDNLGAKRQHKPPTRFHNQCYVADNLTADINEPVNIEEACDQEKILLIGKKQQILNMNHS